ncbi:MAG: hypothetical protein KDD58_08495 [Bdellovibrionales bacterium]|nr:hypothetical protein [Bdellovibrionales bacterium]
MINLDDYISMEREFLHSISTPLMISMSQLEFILSNSNNPDAEELLTKVKKAKDAIDRVSTAVHERRKKIKSYING